MQKKRCSNLFATIVSLTAAIFLPLRAGAQTFASDAMAIGNKGLMVSFNLSSAGASQPVHWGIDTAWLWDWWPLRATNHMQECVSVGRVTIDPRTSGSNTSLASDQTERLDTQLSWLRKSGVKDLFLLGGIARGSAWNNSYAEAFVNDLAMAVTYLRGKGYNVVGVSPFNEPDWQGPADTNAMNHVADLIRGNSTFGGVYVMGPSCLSSDNSNSWWGAMNSHLTMGNTHQLGGSAANFAYFYKQVKTAGKPSAGDEMHNINDALVGMDNGMTYGIWWSDFGGYTRAELGRASNDGSRVGYVQDNTNFSSAAVFKRKSADMANAFLGMSERQGSTSAFSFVSQDRLTYWDGQGPYYDYTGDLQGGSNSERVIEVTWGEDVPAAPLSGSYRIVNKATGLYLTAGSDGVSQKPFADNASQKWTVRQQPYTDGGDVAYATVVSQSAGTYLDGVKYAGNNGAKVQLYAGNGNECERWHFAWKGDGWYVLTNHDSGLSLEGSSDNSAYSPQGVCEWARTGSDRQLWRLIPADAEYDREVPATPTDLTAEATGSVVRLTWKANAERDLDGYMVYRYNTAAKIWETIARRVSAAGFVDNMAPRGVQLRYRLRAIDKSWNKSQPSDEVSVTLPSAKSVVGYWPMQAEANDTTANHLNAVVKGAVFGSTSGRRCLQTGGEGFAALPYNVGSLHTLTFAAWVYPTSSTPWQRVFDFGSGTDNYFFLTTSSGSRPRFEICKDGQKQGLNGKSSLPLNKWSHVAVTIGDDGVRLYINGSLDAETTDVTFRPDEVNPHLSFIGRSMWDADPLFCGSLSDIGLWDYALSADEVYAFYVEKVLSIATDMAAEPMYKETRTALVNATDNMKAAYASGSKTDIATAMVNLETAEKAAQHSMAAYKPLGKALARSKTLVEAHPQDDAAAMTAYGEAYAQEKANYLGGEYTDDDIADRVTVVKTFTNKCLMTDFANDASSIRHPITYLLENAAFDDGTTDGWNIATGRAGTMFDHTLEFWNTTFDISQKLYGMPAGTYRLDIQAFYRNGGKANSESTDVKAVIYMGNHEMAIAPISRGANTKDGDGDWYEYTGGKKVPNDLTSAAYAMNTLRRYTAAHKVNRLEATVTDSETNPLIIGLRKIVAVNDDWTVVRAFKLDYRSALYTSIKSVSSEASEAGVKVYDLQGRLVGEGSDALARLPRGVYFVGGKKVVKSN